MQRTQVEKQAFVFLTYNRTSWRESGMQLERSYITLAGSSKAVKRSRRHTFVIFSSLIRRKRSIRRKKKQISRYVLCCQLEMHFVIFYALVGMAPRATCRLQLLISMGSFHSIKSPVGPTLAGSSVAMKNHRHHINLEVLLIGILQNFQIIR